METLFQNYRHLLNETNTGFVRYLYPEIEWDSRFIAILGGRGVGKTTMLLQHILLSGTADTSLYVTANDTYFSSRTLYDTAGEFYRNGGKYLYIDEVHKYRNWSNEVKMMYDSYKGLQVILSGSSMLAIKKNIDADNSRRIVSYILEGLSFREFLNFKYGLDIKPLSLDEIVAGKAQLPKEFQHPLPLFKDYLETGYFPFFMQGLYYQRLNGIITGTLEEDIASYAELSAAQVRKLKYLMQAVSSSVPYKPNFSDLGREIGIDRKIVPSYLVYMEKSCLIRMLHAKGEGNSYLEKPEKIYLNNCNFINALTTKSANLGNMRETAFFSMTAVRNDVRYAGSTDFHIDGYNFEVGGKNKGTSQIAGLDKAYVVKDDIEFAAGRAIPLWMFGLNY